MIFCQVHCGGTHHDLKLHMCMQTCNATAACDIEKLLNTFRAVSECRQAAVPKKELAMPCHAIIL